MSTVKRAVLGHGAAHRLVVAGAPGAVARLGDGDQLLQDLDLGLARRIGDQHLDDLLEVEEPEGQLHVARADDLGPFAEGSGVLVVRIEQHDVRSRIALEDRAQDERRGARLAGAGGAEDGEVLAEQLVDADHGRDGGVLTDAADAHRATRVAAEGGYQLGLGGDAHAIAERRIGGDAAGEYRRLARLRRAIARRRGPARRSRSRCRRRGGPAPARSARRRWRARRSWPCRWPSACPCRGGPPARVRPSLRAVEQHDGLGAGHRHDAAE